MRYIYNKDLKFHTCVDHFDSLTKLLHWKDFKVKLIDKLFTFKYDSLKKNNFFNQCNPPQINIYLDLQLEISLRIFFFHTLTRNYDNVKEHLRIFQADFLLFCPHDALAHILCKHCHTFNIKVLTIMEEDGASLLQRLDFTSSSALHIILTWKYTFSMVICSPRGEKSAALCFLSPWLQH